MSQTKAQLIDNLVQALSFTGTSSAPANGVYLSATNQLSFATNTTERLRIDSAGQLEAVSLGSASAPTYSWTTDPDTGVYSPGANQVAISTSGTGRLFVDSSGRLGVGTSSPGHALHVSNGNDSASGEFVGITIGGTNSGNARTGSIIKDTTTFDLIYRNQNFSSALGAHVFRNGPSEHARIDSSGRLGLGTSAPAATLEIINGTNNSEYFRAGCISSASTRSIRFSSAVNTGGTDNARHIINTPSSAGELLIQTASTNALFIDSSQRVGIGTTNPAAQNTATALVVGNTSQNNGITILTGTNNDGVLNFNDGENTNLRGYLIYEHSSDSLRFGANGSERGRFDSSGRLLVGTSTARSNVYYKSSSLTPQVLFETQKGDYSGGLALINCSASGYPGVLTLGQSYTNTLGGNGVTPNGEPLGIINFVANDGTNFRSGAVIEANIDATSGSGDVPTRLVFSTTADGASSPTERMRISSAGRVELGDAVGTGTAFFSAKSSLAANNIGQFYASSASYTANVLTLSADRNTSNNTYNFLSCVREGNAFVLHVRDSGNVVNTNNSYGAISDIKLKENIVDASSQWDDLKALQVRNYNFKEGQTHTQIGLIAQEVELVSPGLVSESPDRDAEGNDLGTVTKSVNYSVLYMKAVKALQEAMERIEQLETEMAEVKAQLQAS